MDKIDVLVKSNFFVFLSRKIIFFILSQALNMQHLNFFWFFYLKIKLAFMFYTLQTITWNLVDDKSTGKLNFTKAIKCQECKKLCQLTWKHGFAYRFWKWNLNAWYLFCIKVLLPLFQVMLCTFKSVCCFWSVCGFKIFSYSLCTPLLFCDHLPLCISVMPLVHCMFDVLRYCKMDENDGLADLLFYI